MLLTAKLIALLLGISIAYFLARIGKKKYIGFNWVFFLGLLSPLIAIIFIYIGRSNKTITKSFRIWLKLFAILLILYGGLMLYGSFTTQVSSDPDQKLENLRDNIKRITGEENIGNATRFEFINNVTSYIGRISTGGILSLALDPDVYKSNDYRVKRYFRFYGGILLLYIGLFFLRKDFKQIKTELYK